MTQELRLTNGSETFLLGGVLEDEQGPCSGFDSTGRSYARFDGAGGGSIWFADDGNVAYHASLADSLEVPR